MKSKKKKYNNIVAAASVTLYIIYYHIVVAGLYSSGNAGRTPSGGEKEPTGRLSYANHKAGEYTGPVFIIRELDGEKAEYDAFITTGGIQEVRGPANGNGGGPNQQQQAMKPTAAEDEDTKYFGVLVTTDTVRQLNVSKSSAINVQLSVLLTAVSSRMPWLLVLHRKNYPHLFEFADVEQQQRQQLHAPQAASAGGIPNMQIPQRRRYFSSERQRRGLVFDDGRPAAAAAVVPLAFERELMSTMCYNFLRDFVPPPATASTDYGYDYNDARGDRDIVFDANAYAREAVKRVQQQPAAAASSTVQPQPQPQSQPQPQPSDVDDEQAVKMAIPKRVL